MTGSVQALRAAARRTTRTYAADASDDRPLAGYLASMGAFTALTAAVTSLSRRRGVPPVRGGDLVLLGIATHKLARVVSKEAVASPLRAPFTRYVGPAGPGEVHEEVRGRGARHAVGELLTCPFCLSPWVATGLVAGLAVAPRTTRHAMTVFTAVAVADLLQLTYAAVAKQAEG